MMKYKFLSALVLLMFLVFGYLHYQGLSWAWAIGVISFALFTATFKRCWTNLAE